MNIVTENLREELKSLEEIIHKAERSLEKAPNGILRISKSKNSMQYYKRDDEKDRNGKYIKKKDMNMVYGLAQKDYDKNIVTVAKEQREKICRFLKQYRPDWAKDIYEGMSPERKLLIDPYVLSDEQYINIWQSKRYVAKEFRDDFPQIYTKKGERVRSKTEKILADKFNLMNIPYLYEYPLKLNGYGIVYPDFTLLNVRTRQEFYLEHFGMMDDERYSQKAILKIESYERNGIFPGEKLLLTFETSKYPLNIKLVEQMITKYLM